MEKNQIIKNFLINEKQKNTLERYLYLLCKYNQHTNLVGKSTLKNPWQSHILDSLQVSQHIESKFFSLLDMGTGAGFPGNVLSIVGFKNVSLVDSNGKKIKFLKGVEKELSLNSKIISGRIEGLNNIKYDVIISRALANLSSLLSYSHKFLKKNTVLIFLKGKAVNEEIVEAEKKWKFQLEKHVSLSDTRGRLLVLRGVKKI